MSGAEEARELRAKATSSGGWGWSANADADPRYVRLMDGRYRNRRRCGCGCGSKASHVGMANGLAMASGCEWSMWQWVRDPDAHARRQWERNDEARLNAPNGAVRCAREGCLTPPVLRPAGMTLASVRKLLREQGWSTGAGGDVCAAEHGQPAAALARPNGDQQ